MQGMCSSVPQKVVMKEENIFVDIEVSELFKIWSDEELRKIQALGKKKKFGLTGPRGAQILLQLCSVIC